MLIHPEVGSAVARDARRYWWLFLVRGLFAIALGAVALALPGATLVALVLLIGSYFLIDGLFAIVKALRVLRTDPHWWALLLEGVLGLVAGIVILAWPGISLLSLSYLIGYWAIFTGLSAVFASFRLRVHVPGEWIYTVFALVSIVFGVYVLVMPVTGLIYIITVISIYGFVAGVTLIALAFRLRSMYMKNKQT